MGRWLKLLRERESIAKTALTGTPKTLENPIVEVSKVLSVPPQGNSRNLPISANENLAREPQGAPVLSDIDSGISNSEFAVFVEDYESFPPSKVERLVPKQIENSPVPAPFHPSAQPVTQVIVKRPLKSLFDENASRRHLATFVPITGPGVIVGPVAVALSNAEYDTVIERLIAKAGDEATINNLTRAKSRGSVVCDGERRVFTRGRLSGQ